MDEEVASLEATLKDCSETVLQLNHESAQVERKIYEAEERLDKFKTSNLKEMSAIKTQFRRRWADAKTGTA